MALHLLAAHPWKRANILAVRVSAGKVNRKCTQADSVQCEDSYKFQPIGMSWSRPKG